MAKKEYSIYQINPENFDRFRELSSQDTDLLVSSEIHRAFDPSKDFIELSFYNSENYKVQTISSFTNFSVLSGGSKDGESGTTELSFDIQSDYLDNGFDGEDVKLVYSFFNNPYTSLLSLLALDFYLESISDDRTELRLVALNTTTSDVESVSNELNERFNSDTYVPDLYVNFGNPSPFFRVLNIDQELFRDTVAVLVKLYRPLPTSVNLKSQLSIVEKIADSIAYEVETTIIPEKEEVPFLRGPNFAVDVEVQSTEPSQYFNYAELFSFPTNNTNRELNSLFNEKGAELGLDYSDFSNFINFSSAEERVRNFKYKLDLIESYQSSLDNINSTGTLYTNVGMSGSVAYYENLLNGVVNNFDHYERHLYFESGSTSWPKSNADKPYVNQVSSTTEATDWYINEVSEAIEYDATNPDLLANTIPSFLKEDPDNGPYDLFIDMIGQHFDNLWIYTDAVSRKYDADNRLNKGVSKDLVEDLLRNFGIKLYTSNKSAEDLFRYFTKNTYEFNEEQGLTIIESGTEQLSQNDYQKAIYKRIYHNLPTLLKSKGTERGLRALINCFGIPSDVLKIKIFGGQSALDLPYFGGEQAFTGSIDKVRTNNTGSIVDGNTLSHYTYITNLDNNLSQDLHRVEVGFSPSDNIDSYIVSQSQVLFPNNDFNIDQYIGDPRGYPTNKYTDLYSYSETILNNIDAYNVKDFVRFIKFFDNVLFRMVRDFVPARSVTDAGIILKPHLLDRNKAKAPSMVWTRPEYTGSIDTAFISGSNGGSFKSVGVGAFRGESKTGNNEGRIMTPLGPREFVSHNIPTADGLVLYNRNYGEPKFDGELRNSLIRLSNGELNEGNPFKQIDYPEVRYDVQYWTEIPDSLCLLRTGSGNFILSNPLDNIHLLNSNIFSGDTAIYSYDVEGEEPNISPFVHNFSQPEVPQQYDTFEVQATHADHGNGIANQNFDPPQEGCQETRTVMVVECRLNDGTQIASNPPNPLTVAVNYNLFSFFFDSTNTDVNTNPSLTNTRLTFFVQGVEIGSTIDGIDDPDGNVYQTANGTVNNYDFSYIDPSTNLVTIEVADTEDLTGCRHILTLQFDTCTLRDIHASLDPNPRTGALDAILATNTLQNGSTQHYVYPFAFTGITATTSYFFRIRVRLEFTYRTGPNAGETFSQIYGPVPGYYATTNPPQWISGYQPIVVDADAEFDPFGTQTSAVPSNFTALLEAFPNLHNDLYDEVSGLDVPIVGESLYGVPIEENMFLREIQFKAVTDVNCSLQSSWYDLPEAPGEKRYVDFLHISNTVINTGAGVEITTICNAQDVKRVWVIVQDTYLNGGAITPSQVLQDQLPIYANGDADDYTPADGGIYAYEMANGLNRGRVWNSNLAGNGLGNWRQYPGNTNSDDDVSTGQPPHGIDVYTTGNTNGSVDSANYSDFSSIFTTTLFGLTTCGGSGGGSGIGITGGGNTDAGDTGTAETDIDNTSTSPKNT